MQQIYRRTPIPKCNFNNPCRSAISIKLHCSFIEITLRHGCSPLNLLHIFRTSFDRNTSGRLLLYWLSKINCNIIRMLKRGCLHVKFRPGMKLVPGWNHPCLWWNVSYCLDVFAEMKFHPGMKDRDEISSWDEKMKKKTCKHFIPGLNFKMSMFFLVFDVHIQVCFTNSTCIYNETYGLFIKTEALKEKKD